MVKFYTGIGSRSTPPKYLAEIKIIAETLGNKHWCLRSGGAEGADTAFEEGSKNALWIWSDRKSSEIYLPWKNFNNNKSPLYLPDQIFSDKQRSIEITCTAFEIAAKYHPGWKHLSRGGKLLHARNSFQVLGHDLKTPSSLIICYTYMGHGKGGTGQALRIAKDYCIPIIDLGNKTPEVEKQLADLLYAT